MQPIPSDILTQFESVLKKKVGACFPPRGLQEVAPCIILISEANIRCLIPNQNMCGCLSKNCKKRIRRPNSKSRQHMPFLFILRYCGKWIIKPLLNKSILKRQ